MEIINTYFSNLKKQDELYFSDSKTELSYPSEGNQIYFDVEETSFWFKHRNTCIATLVKKYSPESLFFDIGGGELFLIMMFVLVFFGSKKIPELARGLGKGMREFKDASAGIRREIQEEADKIQKEVKVIKEEVNLEDEKKKLKE